MRAMGYNQPGMRWIFSRFVGAAVAGIGWKVGSDIYDAVKQRMKRRDEPDAEAESNGVAANQAGVVRTDGEGNAP